MNDLLLIHAENIILFVVFGIFFYGAWVKLVKPASDDRVNKATCISKLNGRLTYLVRKLYDLERKIDRNKKSILDRFERLEDKLTK